MIIQEEALWKVIFLSVTAMMTLLSRNIYQFHTREEFSDTKKCSIFQVILYPIPFAIIHFIFDLFWHSKMDSWISENFLSPKRYQEPEARAKRCYTIAKWGYTAAYYFISSIVGYNLIKDTSYFPVFLGGHGDITTLGKFRYLEQATSGMALYYYVQLGKHLSRFFAHAFVRPEGNYYEYLLHHSLSVFLMYFSFCMDMWVIGIFVLIIHDYTDMALVLGRAYKQYKNCNSVVLIGLAIHAVFSWIFLRVFVFSYCCVYNSWMFASSVHQYVSQVELEVFQFPYYFMVFMMGCLQLMHLFWVYYILLAFNKLKTKPAQAKVAAN